MGELHLEVIHQRLRRDFRVDCSLGKLQVAYREFPTVRVSKSGSLERTLSGKKHSVAVSIDLVPAQTASDMPHVTISDHVFLSDVGCRVELEEAVSSGVLTACAQGVYQ